MENDILDTLEDLGYQGPLVEETVFEKAVEGGASSTDYTGLVEWVTGELKGLHGLEYHVNAVTKAEDSDTFLMELSGFLREYGCPHTDLSEGPVTNRLASKENKLLLLDYLLSELEATRIIAVRKPHFIHKEVQEPETNENAASKQLKDMLVALGFPKPPAGITPFQLFSKVEQKIKDLLAAVQPAHISKPLLKARLSEKQWASIDYINTALRTEYTTRREMLLKRLDLTIQSFNWSDKAKRNEDKIASVYQPIRRPLKAKSVTDLEHLLAAREDLLNVEKTSSGTAREKTQCAINRVRIGRVPDRGGRAFEMEAPPPEMPSFQQRQNQPQGQRQRGGHWGGDRSGARGGHQWGSGGPRGGGGGERRGSGGYGNQHKRGKYH